MPHSCCSKHKMTISRVFASRNFRIVPKMATKIADEWMWWRNSALDALLNATCAPKSDGKLRWETLIVHSPTVCNPNSLALHSTFLQHEKDFYCPPARHSIRWRSHLPITRLQRILRPNRCCSILLTVNRTHCVNDVACWKRMSFRNANLTSPTN